MDFEYFGIPTSVTGCEKWRAINLLKNKILENLARIPNLIQKVELTGEKNINLRQALWSQNKQNSTDKIHFANISIVYLYIYIYKYIYIYMYLYVYIICIYIYMYMYIYISIYIYIYIIYIYILIMFFIYIFNIYNIYILSKQITNNTSTIVNAIKCGPSLF